MPSGANCSLPVREVRAHDVRRFDDATLFDCKRQPDELRVRPRERCRGSRAFAEPQVRATGGTFVLGDGSATVGSSETFWADTWSSQNTLSGGAGPSSFKGFANTPSSTPPVCGGTWTSDPGNSAGPPPAPLPGYMAVVVSSAVSKSDSTVTGNITQIVIVKTAAGYGPDPQFHGTGTVVAVLC